MVPRFPHTCNGQLLCPQVSRPHSYQLSVCYGSEWIKLVVYLSYIWKTLRWSQAPCLCDQHSANLYHLISNWILFEINWTIQQRVVPSRQRLLCSGVKGCKRETGERVWLMWLTGLLKREHLRSKSLQRQLCKKEMGENVWLRWLPGLL